MSVFFWIFAAIAVVAVVVLMLGRKKKRNPAKDLGGIGLMLVIGILLLPSLIKRRR